MKMIRLAVLAMTLCLACLFTSSAFAAMGSDKACPPMHHAMAMSHKSAKALHGKKHHRHHHHHHHAAAAHIKVKI